MLSLFQIEFAASEVVGAVCAAFLLAVICPLLGIQISRRVRRFAERPLVCAFTVALTMFAVQAAVAVREGWPVPALHDEFSYLLAADTYSSGRATNPTPAAWEHFETYHVLLQPTYQSKYPPGNGLVLALGQVLSRRPIIGVWICLALATGGLYWMVRGWFSSRWALLGAVMLICNWPMTRQWGQTYFGGTPALLGAVLVYGAFTRLLRRPSWGMAICLGSGLVMWAFTRPYEGLVASVVPMMILSWRGIVNNAHRTFWFARVIAPLVCVLGLGGGLLGWYHVQVTGSPWEWPYRLYEKTYTRRVGTLNTLFYWAPLGARGRTIPSLEYKSSAGQMRLADTKPVLYGLWKTVRQWWFHVGLLGTLPLWLGSTYSLRKVLTRTPAASRKLGWAVLSIALVGTAILLQRSAGFPHYAAPVQPLFILLMLQGTRRLWIWKIGAWQVGQLLVSWLAWSILLAFIVPLATGAHRVNSRPWSLDRDRIQRELESRPRPSLVIVRYGPDHSMHNEWVYNRADLARAQVIWARELDSSRLPQLLEQFPGRDVWTVEPDRDPVRLEEYHR